MPASDSSRPSLLVNLLNWRLHLFQTPLLLRCLDSSRTTVSPVHACMYSRVLFLFLMCVSLEGFEHWISDTHTHSRWKLCQYLDSPEARGNTDANIAFCLCVCVLLVSVSIYALICSCLSSSESEKGKHASDNLTQIFFSFFNPPLLISAQQLERLRAPPDPQPDTWEVYVTKQGGAWKRMKNWPITSPLTELINISRGEDS